jgi:hypothetical protein
VLVPLASVVNAPAVGTGSTGPASPDVTSSPSILSVAMPPLATHLRTTPLWITGLIKEDRLSSVPSLKRLPYASPTTLLSIGYTPRRITSLPSSLTGYNKKEKRKKKKKKKRKTTKYKNKTKTKKNKNNTKRKNTKKKENRKPKEETTQC